MARLKNVVTTESRIIYNTHKKLYWQCGIWVENAKDATIYPDANEANLVAVMRRLGSVDIIHPSNA